MACAKDDLLARGRTSARRLLAILHGQGLCKASSRANSITSTHSVMQGKKSQRTLTLPHTTCATCVCEIRLTTSDSGTKKISTSSTAPHQSPSPLPMVLAVEDEALIRHCAERNILANAFDSCKGALAGLSFRQMLLRHPTVHENRWHIGLGTCGSAVLGLPVVVKQYVTRFYSIPKEGSHLLAPDLGLGQLERHRSEVAGL